jgi:hypothetical protein
VCTCPDEEHDGWVAREYLFNCLQLVGPIHRTCGSSGAALSHKAGAGARAGAMGTRGGPGAALSWEAGTGALRTRGGPGATLPFVLTCSLYVGVPGPQDTDKPMS